MSGPDGPRAEWLRDVERMDRALYAAVVDTPTPSLDRAVRRLTRAADHSKLWMATAAVLAAAGGPRGRQAAVQGLASVAVSSAVVNVVGKQWARRARPDRPLDPQSRRHVRMPTSASFPSGHSASAFAFATGVGARLPVTATPLHAAAGAVAYSRVHAGVHYPGDVVVGSLLGTAIAQIVTRALDRRLARYPAWSRSRGRG